MMTFIISHPVQIMFFVMEIIVYHLQQNPSQIYIINISCFNLLAIFRYLHAIYFLLFSRCYLFKQYLVLKWDLISSEQEINHEPPNNFVAGKEGPKTSGRSSIETGLFYEWILREGFNMEFCKDSQQNDLYHLKPEEEEKLNYGTLYTYQFHFYLHTSVKIISYTICCKSSTSNACMLSQDFRFGFMLA